MPPLILHNVPDDELYTGEDGVQRPYAMVFPDNSEGNNLSTRSRRAILETGSFGKSTRRSRSRTGTPAAKREDPTLLAAESIFNNFFSQKATDNSDTRQRTSILASSSQPNLLGAQPAQSDRAGLTTKFPKHHVKDPTEVILRGFKPSHQYAAIREYERIAGRICEDYPRDPPVEQRRYKVDSGDPASLRRKPLTAEEKAKVHKFAGGEHWIKITFESAETAEAAIECSPQKILGHLVFAEIYRGVPPVDAEILISDQIEDLRGKDNIRFSRKLGGTLDSHSQESEQPSSLLASCMTHYNADDSSGFDLLSSSNPQNPSTSYSKTSISSLDTSTTVSEIDIPEASNRDFCQRIPSARRLKLLPAEQALLPQQSPIQKFLGSLPIIGWISKDIIGGSIPRTENGEFDYYKASLYWKLIWLIEKLTGISLLGDPKDE
ncbi:Nucleoporin NUP53 [Golovinomyces cichoracearum]|uniref:Nucleoporin NUP53 n=1 Tax=Golovinomyces cichoracearum TaxID=62708 RepID=A0A420H975_9PEZI|nr:Nucleoporin NUP53 [Golovinomyces cichoracearum]